MKTYSLIYSETRKQLWALILVPLGHTAVYLFCLEIFGYDAIPFWMSVGLFIAAMIVAMLWIMNKIVNIPVRVTVSEEKLIFELNHTNFLYHSRKFELSLENIDHLTEDVNTQNDYRTYYNIKTRQPSKTIFLMQPRSVENKKIADFSTLLHSYIERYNHKPGIIPASRIREGSFYDAGWAKTFTVIVYAAIVILTVFILTGSSIAWYKLLQFYVFAGVWLLAYHVNTNKRKMRASKHLGRL